MAQQNINVGTANAKAGDTLKDAFDKTEANFTELYTNTDLVTGINPVAPAGAVFVADGAGGGEFIRIPGWHFAVDTNTTVTTPSQTLTSGSRTLWINDGGTSNTAKDPSDLVDPLWNTTTNEIQPIANNDTYNIRINFSVENYSGSSPYIDVELDIGSSQGVIVANTIPLLKSGAQQDVSINMSVFAGTIFNANNGEIYVTYNGTGTCDIYNNTIFITRDSKNYV